MIENKEESGLNEQQMKAASHIDGPLFVSAVPGSGKCIIGDSIVILDEGFSRIDNDKVEYIKSFDSENVNLSNYRSIKINNFIDSGIQPTIKIITKQGYNIQGTHDHPIMILNKECELEWKKLKEIKTGDFAAIQMEKMYDNPIIRHPELFDIWYIIGLLLGDGYLKEKNILNITTNDDEIEESFNLVFKNYFNYEVKKYHDKRRKNLRSLYVCSKSIKYELYNRFGDFFHLACEKKLTDKMLAGSRGEIGSLIQGLFDTDGYVDRHTVGICLCSKKLIEQIHVILLRFGVFSSLKTKVVNGSTYYRLSIYGENLRRFEKNIGFRLSRKKEKLKRFTCLNSNPNKIIPFSHYLVSKIYDVIKLNKPYNYDPKTSNIYDSDNKSVRLVRYCLKPFKNRRGLTEHSARILISACEIAKINCHALDQLKFLIKNFEFSEISYVEDGGNKHVYDYFIEGSHNFIANGFVNHNTKTIIQRTINLINSGISPRSILSLTFTNKAAKEMKERIIKCVGDEISEHLYMGTFHALSANILRKMGGPIGYGHNMTIYDSDDQDALMAQSARSLGFELSAPEISYIIWKTNDLREKIVTEEEFINGFDQVWKSDIALAYLKKMRDKGAVDFSGLLSETIRLLENHPSVLKKLQDRFKYIQIDESQDCNKAQLKIAYLIGETKNIFIAGDMDQSIYIWRGAHPEGIYEFVKDFNAKEIRLPVNYRSTPQIVNAASSLISYNPNRPKDFSFETVNEDGEQVDCFRLDTPEIEGQWIANKIKNLIESGSKAEDIAILYRMNSMSRAIESGLVHYQIPYQVLGGYGFYDRKEIKDALAMLRFLVNPYDSIALSRFINKPKRGIGEGTLSKIENFAESNGINILESLKRSGEYINTESICKHCYEIASVFDKDYSGKNIGETLTDLIENLRYDEYLKTDKESNINYEDRKDNQQELVNSAAVFSVQRNNDIVSYLQNISLSTSSDKDTNEGKVTLMTLHSSKGLEFPFVFMPRMEENLFPHKRAITERKDGIDEERRLCFVGMTRAKKKLVCSFSDKSVMKYGKGGVQFVKNIPSRFIKEADLKIQPILKI